MTTTHASLDNSADSLAFRAAIRRERLAARLALASDAHRHTATCTQIERHLSDWFSARAPTRFGFCAAIRGEFDAQPLAKRLIAQGWQAAMAVSVQANCPLEFREWTPQSTMITDRHGIPVPQSALVAAPDILLIPLLAFDAQGFRLGYGGGYFDRTLSALATRLSKPLAVGVGFALAKVDTVYPQVHDEAMDFIITENGICSIAPDGKGLRR